MRGSFIGEFLAGGNESEWYLPNKPTIRTGEVIGYYAQDRSISDCDMHGDFRPAFRKAFRYTSMSGMAAKKTCATPEPTRL